MEQEIYHKLKKQIQERCDQEMEALDSISVYLGSFKPNSEPKLKTMTKPVKIVTPKPGQPSKTVSLEPENKSHGFRLSRPDYMGRIRKVAPLKTDQCTIPDCTHRVHPGNPACVACTRKVCSKHKKGDECVTCHSSPA